MCRILYYCQRHFHPCVKTYLLCGMYVLCVFLHVDHSHFVCAVLVGRRYLKEISKLRLTDTHVCKVTKHRIFSLVVHPSVSHLLVAAGDKWGGVGLWNVVSLTICE